METDERGPVWGAIEKEREAHERDARFADWLWRKKRRELGLDWLTRKEER